MNGKQLKNSILQWAIQGKLVPQDPNDEPASVLLERIRAEKARLVKEKKIKKDKNESIIYRGDDNSYYEKFLTTGEVKCIDEEIPFEIPKGWEWARINAIGVSQLGKTLDRGKESGKEYPYLCSINVYWDSINLSKIKTFRLRDDELPKYKLRKGDLLICEGGDYGRCCIWDRNEDMYYQNALHRVRFHGGLIPSFYKYVFELYRNIGYIVGQGQTIKHFTYEKNSMHIMVTLHGPRFNNSATNTNHCTDNEQSLRILGQAGLYTGCQLVSQGCRERRCHSAELFR
jgi:type I restriction enzyme S subunit